MTGKATYGGLFSVLTNRDINQLSLHFETDGMLEEFEVDNVYELRPQQILDICSYLGNLYGSGMASGNRVIDPEGERLSRERGSFYSKIKQKMMRYAKRLNTGLRYPPILGDGADSTPEGLEKNPNFGKPIYGS